MPDNQYDEACRMAEESSDPILVMLRDADERLQRSPPDLHGVSICVYAARLAIAYKLMSAPPPPDHINRFLASLGVWRGPFLVGLVGFVGGNALGGLAIFARGLLNGVTWLLQHAG